MYVSLLLLLSSVHLLDGAVHHLEGFQRRLSRSEYEGFQRRLSRSEYEGRYIFNKYREYSPFDAVDDDELPTNITNNEYSALYPQKGDADGIDLMPKGCGIRAYYTYMTNISLGTPPRNVSVEVDFFYFSDLVVAAKNGTNGWHWEWDNVKNWLFNSTGSSTCVRRGNSTYEFRRRAGYFVNDVMRIGTISANQTFLLLNNLNGHSVEPGLLGLSPYKSHMNATSKRNLVDQLELDTPIVTMAPKANGTFHITLGEVDTQHCNNDTVLAPNVVSFNDTKLLRYYGLNASSVSALFPNGTVTRMDRNISLYVQSGDGKGVYATPDIRNLIIKASGGVYNASLRAWVTDCNVTKSGNIVLGVKGRKGEVVLTPRDYLQRIMEYKKPIGLCQVVVYRSWVTKKQFPKDLIFVTKPFLRGHCLSHNMKTGEVGISSSKYVDPIA